MMNTLIGERVGSYEEKYGDLNNSFVHSDDAVFSGYGGDEGGVMDFSMFFIRVARTPQKCLVCCSLDILRHPACVRLPPSLPRGLFLAFFSLKPPLVLLSSCPLLSIHPASMLSIGSWGRLQGLAARWTKPWRSHVVQAVLNDLTTVLYPSPYLFQHRLFSIGIAGTYNSIIPPSSRLRIPCWKIRSDMSRYRRDGCRHKSRGSREELPRAVLSESLRLL